MPARQRHAMERRDGGAVSAEGNGLARALEWRETRTEAAEAIR